MYTSDIGTGAAQLFAAPVTSSEALADLDSIDPSEALEVRVNLSYSYLSCISVI